MHPPAYVCSKVDALAAKMGARPDLASRAAMAVQQCLSEAAAQEGHTYLSWHRLEKDCSRLLKEVALQHAAPWEHTSALHLVAQHMHTAGTLVAEPPAAPGEQAAAAAAQQLQEASGEAAEAAAAEAASSGARAHPLVEGIAELKAYLNSKLSGQWGSTLCSAGIACLLD